MLPQAKTALCVSPTYNNAGFYLAGRVLEVVVGQPYEALVQQLVLDPLDMHMSFFSLLSRCDLELRDGTTGTPITPKDGFPTKDSPASPTPPPTRLALCGDDQVIALDEPHKDTRGEFLRNPDGSIAWLRLGGRVHAKQLE